MPNPASRARTNVAQHYDLSAELYDLFLDADRQYSCAYFARPDMTLEEAQAAKKAHIAKKLCLDPGMRVFEIGSGWGGRALTICRFMSGGSCHAISEGETTGLQWKSHANGAIWRISRRRCHVTCAVLPVGIGGARGTQGRRVHLACTKALLL